MRTVSQDVSLGSLKVNQSNSYGGTVSPEVTAEEHYYTFLTAGTTRTFMNVWPDVAESHATVRVFLLENAAGKNEKEIDEDGSLKVTATNNKHDRYAVYFADGDKPMAVRIEITSENGEVDNYYLVISKEASAEEGKALLEKLRSDNKLADQAAADAVNQQILAIGTVTTNSQTAVEEARAAYNALTVTQRALVTDYETLTTAEAALQQVLKEAADQAAASAVVDKISAIGTVTLDSKTAIEATRAAYDALTDEQKALVTNYSVLTAAEKTLSSLISGNPATGDNTNIMLYTTIMLVSFMGIAALLLTYKKKYQN